MSTVVIPTRAGSDQAIYTIKTTLDGVPFQLYFQYNLRQDAWYLSVATVDGQDIYNGLLLATGWGDLLLGCSDSRRPPGRLTVISNTADTSDPGLNDLGPGGRCALEYVPVADVTTIVVQGHA